LAGFTDYLEAKLLDHIFTDPAYTPPSTLYLGLLSGTASDDAGGGLTEVSTSGTAYARIALTASDFAAATGTAPVTKSSSAAKSFAQATANYASGGNITYWGIWDASSAGNLLMIGQLTTAKPVLSGDTATVASGALVVKMGDPGDTY
jgi:hypothetical protein